MNKNVNKTNFRKISSNVINLILFLIVLYFFFNFIFLNKIKYYLLSFFLILEIFHNNEKFI